MKESVGYTVTINIIIVFITIVFTFLAFSILHYKSNKIGNVIARSIEKYEGYNNLAKNEISVNMESLGYSGGNIDCPNKVDDKNANDKKCSVIDKSYSSKQGYCVYGCKVSKEDGTYNYYKIRTNMIIDFPIIHDIVTVPIYINTNLIYDFES